MLRPLRRAAQAALALPPPAAPYSSAAGAGSAAAEWLAQFTNYERQGVPRAAGTDSAEGFDLGRMRRLLGALGDPQRAWRAVHVAGTKGKGSVSAMLAAALAESHYRVGAYTSPHVVTLGERIALNGAPLAPGALDDLVARHAGAVEAAQRAEHGALTHFEVLTALAFKHFQEQGVQVAVVEAGLGGARDATNVLPPDSLAAAVVTPVGRDHAAALGGSLESIAAAKAGIMQAGRPLVLARQPEPAAQAVLLARAAELGCPIFSACEEALLLPHPSSSSSSSGSGPQQQQDTVGGWRQRCQLRLRGWTAEMLAPGADPSTVYDVRLRLLGAHQRENAATAVAAAACLRHQGLAQITLPAVVAGLEAATLPGRFQLCRFAELEEEEEEEESSGLGAGEGGSSSSQPWVVLDGAHTPESAAALVAALQESFPDAPLALVLAMAEDKDHAGVCAALRTLRPRLVAFTQVAIAGGRARAAAPGALAGAWQAAAIAAAASGAPRQRGTRTRELIQASLGAAVEKARSELTAAAFPGQRGVVVVCGSLHAVGAALRQPPLEPL